MPELTVSPLTRDEYPRFLELVTETYANNAAASGEMTFEQARARAAQDLEALLPKGPETPSMLLRSLHTADQCVGHIWLGLRGAADAQYGWIWDIYVDPRHRGNQYGASAIRLIEAEAARFFGVTEVRLNVFATNAAAVHLYERLGYSVTSQVMRRSID